MRMLYSKCTLVGRGVEGYCPNHNDTMSDFLITIVETLELDCLRGVLKLDEDKNDLNIIRRTQVEFFSR